MQIAYLLGSLFFVWLAVITYFLFKTRKHYFDLTTRTGKDKIDSILDKLVADDLRLNQEIDKIKKETKSIIEDSRFPLREIGLVGFNPFDKRGSDQSFVLALLNAEKNGIVINFIYTHDGVRVYAKKVRRGEGEGHKLSDEEHEAIKNASIVN